MSSEVIYQFEVLFELFKASPNVDIFLFFDDYIKTLQNIDYVVNPSSFYTQLFRKTIKFDFSSIFIIIFFKKIQTYFSEATVMISFIGRGFFEDLWLDDLKNILFLIQFFTKFCLEFRGKFLFLEHYIWII